MFNFFFMTSLRGPLSGTRAIPITLTRSLFLMTKQARTSLKTLRLLRRVLAIETTELAGVDRLDGGEQRCDGLGLLVEEVCGALELRLGVELDLVEGVDAGADLGLLRCVA